MCLDPIHINRVSNAVPNAPTDAHLSYCQSPFRSGLRTHILSNSHKSILDYFHAQGLTESYQALLKESKVDFVPEPKTKYSGLLEKKWTSVIRLQKKVCLSF